MREPEPPEPARSVAGRRALAIMWGVWTIWMIVRPVGETEAEPGSRGFIAAVLIAFMLLVVRGLVQLRRWPVTVSRALIIVLALFVIVGPAGRVAWAYGVDIAFAALGMVLAFVLIRIGTRPPPANQPEWVARRADERRERIRRDFRR